jgi:hypothetical protein
LLYPSAALLHLMLQAASRLSLTRKSAGLRFVSFISTNGKSRHWSSSWINLGPHHPTHTLHRALRPHHCPLRRLHPPVHPARLLIIFMLMRSLPIVCSTGMPAIKPHFKNLGSLWSLSLNPDELQSWDILPIVNVKPCGCLKKPRHSGERNKWRRRRH